MGGEPTFVSIDDFEGAEWNTAADGPLKRKLLGTPPFKSDLLTEALSILDKENGILVSYSLAGNMHYTGERRFAIMEKRRFNSQRRKYKIHFSRC
jgi:hypothetical protein